MPETMTIAENQIPNATPNQPESMNQVEIFQQFSLGSNTPIGTDIIPFQRGLEPSSAAYGYYTADQLATWIRGTATVAWGNITGTLSDQTDLQAALNLKAPLAGAALTGATVNGVTLSTSAGSGLFLQGDGTYAAPAETGGTVTDVSVVTANGISGSVANPSTTPAITLSLGAITPSSMAAVGTVSGSNLSGTNTGDLTLGSSNGLSLVGQSLSLELAGAAAVGALSSADWNTFNNKLSTAAAASTYVPYSGATGNLALGAHSLSASNFSGSSSGTNTGDITLGTTNGLSLAGQALSLGLGSSSVFGAVKVDGTTITASGGVISAVSAAAGITFTDGTHTVTGTTTLTVSGATIGGTSPNATLTVTGGGGGTPGGTNGQVQFNNAGAFDGFTVSGDGTLNTTTGALAITKTGGVAFAASATTDTTTTANITDSTNKRFVTDAELVVIGNTSGTNSGDVSIGTANGLSLVGQALSLALASTSTTGALSSTDWNTFNGKQQAITLTTTGTSGASTLVAGALNIPVYQAAGTYVTSVTGTTNRITSSGGTTPAIDISAAYVGQTSLTTLGTITTGVWNGTAIANANLANSAVTISGHSLSLGGTLNLVAGDVGLGNVTNDVQTKAAVVPNTAPSAGQALIGNAGGTAYAPTTISGAGATITMSSAGVLTISAIANATLTNSAITIAGTSTSLGGSITQDTITGLSSTGLIKRTGANTLAIAAAGTDYLAPFGSQTANFFYAAPNGSPGAPTFRAIVAADIPTLNQNTTGSAAKWTTARNLAGNSVDGSANVAFANKFIVQGTTDAGLSAAQFLGALGTGLIKNTTTTGILSIATSGTDYSAGTSALATGILKSTTATGALTIAVAGDFPTLNQNTTGQAGSVVNATLTTALTVNTGTVTLLGNAANTSALTIGAGAVSVSGSNSGDVTIGTGNGLSLAGQALSLGLASASVFGAVKVDGTTIVSVSGVISAVGGGTGTVTSVSVVTANGISGSVATATTTPAITLSLAAITPTTVNGLTLASQLVGFTIAGGTTSKTLTVPLDATVSGTNTGDQTSVTGNAGTATALQNACTIGGVSFNGTANITVATATGGFTVSGGDLAIGANNLTITGSIGATGARVTKGWFTDLQVTNAIAGSITGNAATVTTNANLTGVITSSGNVTSIASQTGTGTKFVVDTSPTLVTPLLGTPTSGTLTNCTGLPISGGVSGLGSGVATFLATPSSANLITAMTDKTGTGFLVFSASPTFTGTIAGAAATLTGSLYLNGGTAWSATFSNGNSGTSKALNLDNGTLQSVTITGAVAMTLTTPTHPGKFTVIVTQDGTGHVYSFTGIKWAGGTPPTYSAAASKVDVFSFVYDGTNTYGVGGIAFS